MKRKITSVSATLVSKGCSSWQVIWSLKIYIILNENLKQDLKLTQTYTPSYGKHLANTVHFLVLSKA